MLPCCHSPWGAHSGAPLIALRAPIGAPRHGEHNGAHPMAEDFTGGEIWLTRVSLPSVCVTGGAGDPPVGA